MPTFDATPAEVHSSLRFEADCTIGAIEPHASPSIVTAVKVGDQVTHIGEDEVTDRAELRSLLSQMPDTTKLQFTFVHGNRTAAQPTGTDFESSVMLNGTTCAFAAARPGLSKEEAEEEADYRSRMEAFVKAGSKAGGSGLPEFATAGDAMQERTLRTTLRNALAKVEPGRCVIGIGDAQFNPVDEVKILAEELKLTAPVLIDFGVKLRHRVSKEQIRARFVDAMEKGKWFVVLRGTKSIVLLGYLGALFEELHENEEEKKKALHDDARIIICGEPHPHFPPQLTKGSKCLQIKTAFEQSSLMYESVASSMSALRIASDQDTSVQPNKKVKIASAVHVVDIDPREVNRQDRAPPRPQVNVAGTVKQKATFAALPHDKFFGISFAGSRNRIALASSLGNVYIVDDSGSSLMSFHAHDAAVWDVSFSSEHDFVTGGEDQNAVVWTRDAKERDALVCRDVIKCANDVYAVQHSASGRAVAVGGLMPKITIRGTETGKVESVNLPTSNQAMAAVGTDYIVSGGGDGSVFLIDTITCKAISTCTQHTKKCPAVTATGNVVISGSFDCTVRLWDTRSASQQSLHTMKFQHYVTGLAADENYLTACVGDNLYLWDTRNLSVVLGGQPQAWTGLSRAVCIDASSRQIVSASPDGVARFWTFGGE